jgi:hypothetical protein
MGDQCANLYNLPIAQAEPAAHLLSWMDSHPETAPGAPE